MNDVAIIGGGASGLFCAIYVKHLLNKENIHDVNITIYERLEKTGKKLLPCRPVRTCSYPIAWFTVFFS